MKIAVTGAAGNIGRRLCPELAREHEVVGIDLRDADVLCDVRDFAGLLHAFAGCEAVVHLGGISNNEAPWQPIYESNIGGTYNAYEAARQCGVRQFIFASSNHAVGQYEVDFVKPEAYRGGTGFCCATMRRCGLMGIMACRRRSARRWGGIIPMRLGCAWRVCGLAP